MTSLIKNHYCDNVTFLKSKLYSKRLFTRCEKVEKKKPLWKPTAYLLLIHCPQWCITVQLLICIKSVLFPFILGDFGCDSTVKLVRKLHQGYTCQLSRLRRESHACGLKTSISRLLTLAGQFLTPD